ncbi:MAG: arginine deiminase family protein [Nitrososphaerota archaeon]
MNVGVKAEWHRLRSVVIHRPGIEMHLGLLAPYASLYERAFHIGEAIREHQRLEYILKREFGIAVHKLKAIILRRSNSDVQFRARLIDTALEWINFRGNREEVLLAKKDLEANSEILDPVHFFNILLLHPLIDLSKGKGSRAIYLDITERQPLSNLYFMRDQQAITDNGIFISRMSKPQRRRESLITRLAWEALDIPITHETQSPGTFEGGDFMPMQDFALIGVGDRTNYEGVNQMMNTALGFPEVAVVHQPKHPLLPDNKTDRMISMHLDTYLNVASSSIVVGNELMLKGAKVEVYTRERKGRYLKRKETTDLYSYLKKKGFTIIGITTLEQMCYATNFLCVQDGMILAVETDRIARKVLSNLQLKAKEDPQKYGMLMQQASKDYEQLRMTGNFFPHKKEIYENGIDAFPIILTNLTGGYGGAHCMTCSLYRS